MDGCDILSEEQCRKIVQRYAGTKNVDVKFFSVNPLTSQLDGLLGEQYFVNIHYQVGEEEKEEEDEVQFFLKTVNGSNPVVFEISKSIYAYDKEAFYYETLVPLLQSKGFQCNFVARSYLCEPYFIVLDDLSKLSYTGTPKNKPLDLHHCKRCLETLAKFHVVPILYEIAKKEELNKSYSLQNEFSDILEDKIFSQEENAATKFFRCSIRGLFQLVDLIPENGVNKKDFKVRLEDSLNDIMASREDSMGFRCTVLHGDLWSNNFLFKYDNREIIDCKLIDFQIIKYGPPAMDVLQFILTNTRRTFRDEHHDELLAYYYNCFSDLLAENGFQASEILSESEFKKSCYVFMLPAKIHAVVDRGITCMSDETFVEASQSEEGFRKFLYEERGRYIVNSFNQDRYFRELMIEEVTELRDMLFGK